MTESASNAAHSEGPADAFARQDFSSDYMEGAHPRILERLIETNLEKTPGYGFDRFSASARDRIRRIAGAPEAAVHFLAGGTQSNAVMIRNIIPAYQGIIAAESAHIATHEAGAIEAAGRKVITLPHEQGKLSAESIERCFLMWEKDSNREHVVMPGGVYLSQPTECGTLYSRSELEAISAVCRSRSARLIVDGARLAYALGSPDNDATIADLARLADAFYIGGTKCGALLGEAVVIPDPSAIPHFFSLIKQQGALLAKGRAAAIQFDVLFEDGLYEELGRHAVRLALKLARALQEKGYRIPFASPTNQQYVVLSDAEAARLSEKVGFQLFERIDESTASYRFATSWASREEDVDALIDLL